MRYKISKYASMMIILDGGLRGDFSELQAVGKLMRMLMAAITY